MQEGSEDMSVLKVIEIMGDSEKGWEQAAQEAVTDAAKTVKNIRSVWIKDHAATVEGGKIKRYRVTCKITFEVENRSRSRSR
jgi:flavin-binding protein dodecin